MKCIDSNYTERYFLSPNDSFAARMLPLFACQNDLKHKVRTCLKFLLRIGLFYPDVSDFNMENCPRFWRNRKVEIRLLNLTEAKYMDAILPQTPYIIIATSLLIGIFNFVYVWYSSNLKEVYKQIKRQWWSKIDGMIPNCLTRLYCFKEFAKYSFIIRIIVLFTLSVRIILLFTLPVIDTSLGKSV